MGFARLFKSQALSFFLSLSLSLARARSCILHDPRLRNSSERLGVTQAFRVPLNNPLSGSHTR